jgi:hypothetical protein
LITVPAARATGHWWHRDPFGEADGERRGGHGRIAGMDVLELLDWRRQAFALYDGVRAELYPHVAHAGWCAVRDQLFADHPQSPVVRDDFDGLRVADYDPAWRALVRLEQAAPQRIELPTAVTSHP